MTTSPLQHRINLLADFLGVERGAHPHQSSILYDSTGVFRLTVLGRKGADCFYVPDQKDTSKYSGLVIDCVARNPVGSLASTEYLPVWLSKKDENVVLYFMENTLGAISYQPHWVHGTMAQVDGKGVLIIGGSGAGKTRLLQSFLGHGNQMVADDVVECVLQDDNIIARAPITQYGFLFDPRHGLVDVPACYGVNSLACESPIDIVVAIGESFAEKNIVICGKEFKVYTINTSSPESVYDLLDYPFSAGSEMVIAA